MNCKLLTGITLFLMCIYILPGYSQVTIGSGLEPVKAAIVDVKEKTPVLPITNDEENETVTSGGILMPRVFLGSLQSLDPILDASSAANPQEQLKHVGLLVYNMNEDPLESLVKGMYYWSGSDWKLLMTGDVASTGPWYKVGVGTNSKLNIDNSYLNANVVVGGNAVATVNGTDASLTIDGGDASINGLTVGRGAGNIDSNTVVGQTALKANTSGNNNVAIGNSALIVNTTGGNNTAGGYMALSGLITGGNNTAIGSLAGSNITTGSNNLMIGTGTSTTSATGNNQINIGNALFGISGNTPVNNRVGIGRRSPDATLHVDKSLTVTKAEYMTNDIQVLVIDSDTIVGVRESTPILFAYVQSTQSNSFSSVLSNLNNSMDIVVPWSSTDVISSNAGILTFVSANNSFRINRTFAAEISGYINYASGASYPSSFSSPVSYDRENGSALLNLKLQLSTDNGATWEDLTNTRGIWTYAELGNQLQTVETPVVITNFHEGDHIRLVIQRPILTSGTRIGLSHGTGTAISPPSGIPYSKALRVVGL
ncbi:hypothetical protein LJC00_02280 [Dysgonomonas sp. OttesenSCG-928-M03]|nr:hypothetical protein [Dysgonomonas sp. OttesenSCG-928-M03]